MKIWKKIIRVGTSKAIIIDKILLNGESINIGDEVLIDIIKFRKAKDEKK